MKKTKIDSQFRNLNITSGNIDEEARTVDLSFSSEVAVARYFGNEILDHDPKSVNLSRLNNGAAVLEDHYGSQIGKVVSAKIEDGRGIAKLKFSSVGKGANIFTDIVEGIRENISVGYSLNDLTRVDDIEGEPTFRSMNWMPFEISVVGTPADTSVGIGRSKENTTEIEVDDSFRSKETIKDIIPKIEEEEKKQKKFISIREKELLLLGK